MVAIVQRDINVITAEFVAIKRQAERMILDSAIEMGRRLCEAKSILPHGEWGEWLKEKADISSATASNLMRIFDEYGAEQFSIFGAEANSQTLGNLSYSKAVALLAVPSEERETFVKDVKAEELSTREFQQAIKERNDAIKEKEKVQKETEKRLKQILELEEDIDRLELELQNVQDGAPDLSLIDNSKAEAIEVEKKAMEEKLKKKIAKAEDAKIAAIAAKELAEINLIKQKDETKSRLEAAEIERKVLNETIESLNKRLSVGNSSEMSAFKVHFEAAQSSINKMLSFVTDGASGEVGVKLGTALFKLCASVMENLPGECGNKGE